MQSPNKLKKEKEKKKEFKKIKEDHNLTVRCSHLYNTLFCSSIN